MHPEGTYFIEWREGGKRRRETAVREDAVDQVRRKAVELRAIRDGLIAAPESEPVAAPNTPIGKAIDDYLRYVRMQRKKRTYLTYRYTLGTLLRASYKKKDVEDATRDDVLDFMTYCYEQGLGARTVYDKVVTVLQLFKKHGRAGLMEKGDWPKYVDAIRPIYEPEELHAMFKAATENEADLLKFILGSGFRGRAPGSGPDHSKVHEPSIHYRRPHCSRNANAAICGFPRGADSQRKDTLLISGGTGSGKTTLLQILAHAIPEHERIVVIEDTSELCIQTPNVLAVECQADTFRAAISFDDLLKSALRWRPDRIILGEVRGIEARTLLDSSNTGHDGSLATIHARSATRVLSHFANLVMRSHAQATLSDVEAEIGEAVNPAVGDNLPVTGS